MKDRIKKMIPEAIRPQARIAYYHWFRPVVKALQRSVHLLPDKITLQRGKRNPLTPVVSTS